jgi:hypothetical protein
MVMQYKVWCDQYYFFSSVLEPLENEKFAMLSGSALDRHGAAVAEDDATDQMLEDFGSFEDGRRLRKCVLEDGE